MSGISTGKNQTGFTLVELMLATALFSFILMFATAGFVQVNRAYNKGHTVKRMHQSGRAIMDNLTRTFLNSVSADEIKIGYESGEPRRICFGTREQFEWVEGYVDYSDEVPGSSLRYSLVHKTEGVTSSCGSLGTPLTGANRLGTEILTEPLVAVNSLAIENTGKTYRITLNLATNDPELTPNSPTPCEPTDPYCDFVELETTVTLRD